MTVGYADLATLKATLNINDTSRDSLLNQALAAASRGIDRHTGRRFDADTTATARVYRLHGRTVSSIDGEAALVDDIASATGLVVEVGSDSTFVVVADYTTEPDNALVLGRPITVLRRTSGCWASTIRTRLRVTARWGWPAIPDEIVQATLIQAARLFRRKDSPEGITGSAEWGLVRLSRLDPDVQALTAPYMLPGIA